MLQNADAGQYLLSPKDMNTLDILPNSSKPAFGPLKSKGA